MDQEKRIENIEDNIRTIKENHLTHIEVSMARLDTNVSWIMKYLWVVITASVGAIATGVVTLLINFIHK